MTKKIISKPTNKMNRSVSQIEFFNNAKYKMDESGAGMILIYRGITIGVTLNVLNVLHNPRKGGISLRLRILNQIYKEWKDKYDRKDSFKTNQ